MEKTTRKASSIKMCIAEAILELLKDHSLKTIYVNDICDKAFTGRSTYYRHFGNKEGGKKEAIYFYLQTKWEDLVNKSDVKQEDELDDLYLKFIYSIKDTLLLLSQRKLLSPLQRLIMLIFGPKKDEKDNEWFYKTYAGAGIWLGLTTAIILKKFSVSPDEAHKILQSAFNDGYEAHLKQMKLLESHNS